MPSGREGRAETMQTLRADRGDCVRSGVCRTERNRARYVKKHVDASIPRQGSDAGSGPDNHCTCQPCGLSFSRRLPW